MTIRGPYPDGKAVLLPQKVMIDRNTLIGLAAALLCLAFVFTVQSSGASEKEEAVKEMLTATMDIHDEAMREMADMNRIGRMLKKEVQDLNPETPHADSILTVIQAIKQAEEDMYTWMRLYEAPTELPPDEALLYLEDQKAKISQNLADIQAAHEAGKKMVTH